MSMLEADYEEMDAEASNINKAAQEYINAVEELYTIVDNLREVWEGTDNTVYTETVNSYKSDIQNLGTAVNNYARFLNKAAGTISETQNTVKSGAAGL